MELRELKTEFLGQKLLYYKSIDSTQIKIKSIVNPENGTIVIADSQYSGQGTHSRKWYTGNAQNIAMSFVLLPNCKISKIINITVLLAKCVVDTIKNLYNIELDIKEPNDVYCKGKKIGGILTETICKGEIVNKIYIGIGINVNQDEFPEDLCDIATSLKREFGKEFSREEIIVNFLNNFEKVYLKIQK